MKTVELKAHAKLNLYLNIKHKRDDGFHELETVMLPISLADDVRVSVFDSCNCKTNVKMVGMSEEIPHEKNLAWKAAEKFREKTSYRNDIQIEICKNIPAGAGMGGGSSDAASVLVALNSLTGEHLSSKMLQDLASHLGSDVPFFILNQLSICTGRGEIIHPVKQKSPQKRWFVIAVPEVGVNTALAYKCFSELPASRAPSLLLGISLKNG